MSLQVTLLISTQKRLDGSDNLDRFCDALLENTARDYPEEGHHFLFERGKQDLKDLLAITTPHNSSSCCTHIKKYLMHLKGPLSIEIAILSTYSWRFE
jgi:hypothetical protein